MAGISSAILDFRFFILLIKRLHFLNLVFLQHLLEPGLLKFIFLKIVSSCFFSKEKLLSRGELLEYLANLKMKEMEVHPDLEEEGPNPG